ncbi:MAG: hypothetical protein CMK65_01075 [Pseudoalteromonas sp.]|uniref:glycosyltransferase family 4 protein n=1 Tax=Pseudoalteromonas sp. TaxID=53249 RepID=UPI000C8F01E9|nr:glycosyltransferase family 4 protein [Pseudoalteromonas sp.]MAD02206.1 hypothetical protein [Pseudoalteromonas sp.]|tara:strand:+ start:60667 stop:61869 length:1203 start_codon:yes stop_codon:yes gene_type:complete
MKVVILTETFAKNMGYMGNMLPKYMAKLGVDVHVIALDLPPYYQIQDFKASYEDFIKTSDMRPGKVEQLDGYTLHILAHKRSLGYMKMQGLDEKLKELKPDVVYSINHIGWLAMQASIGKLKYGYKLYTGSHTTASVFPLSKEKNLWLKPAAWRNLLIRGVSGRLTSYLIEKCYGATSDCADVAVRFFGVQKSKIDVVQLGVDTDTFQPANGEHDEQRRQQVRAQFGFADDEIICIYTGRFSEEKNPVILAKAIDKLRAQGKPYKAIFFGNGVQKKAIEQHQGCTVHPFVPVDDLGDYFRACEIGVWPTQESTSMLDAAACGLPIVVNDTLQAVERVQGNGLEYRLNDVDDMVTKLLELSDPQKRQQLGSAGAKKMKERFSWNSMAQRRVDDFTVALTAK